MTVRFHSTASSEVLNTSGLPNTLIQSSSGETLFDHRGDQIDRVSGVNEQVAHTARDLLGKSRKTAEDDSRVLFQRLHIERVLIQEVPYRFGNSGEKRLWIYGNERHIYAPKAPLAWGRIAAAVAGAVAALVVILLIVKRTM